MNDRVFYDQKSFDHAAKLFTWNKWLLSALGIWPKTPNNFLFIINWIYFVYHLVLEYLDLFLTIDNSEQVIDNLTENMTFTQLLVRLAMLKIYNEKLGLVIGKALNDYEAKIYRNDDESKLFIDHINKAKFSVKILCIFFTISALSLFVRPIISPQPVDESDMKKNDTMSFTLPYRFYIFYEVNDWKTYVLTYASQFPFVFVTGFTQAAADCLMITLVFHVSGKLAVLAIRITQIESDDANICKMELKNIIIEHNRLMDMAGYIGEAFSETLLTYLTTSTILICILGFQLLSNYVNGQNADIPTFCVYIFSIYLVVTALCVINETLISQSHEVCQAFYNCKWYEMPTNTAQSLVQCMAQSQKPLGLTVGKFGILYFNTLTTITRTAMAYLSVLRSLLTV